MLPQPQLVPRVVVQEARTEYEKSYVDMALMILRTMAGETEEGVFEEVVIEVREVR